MHTEATIAMDLEMGALLEDALNTLTLTTKGAVRTVYGYFVLALTIVYFTVGTWLGRPEITAKLVLASKIIDICRALYCMAIDPTAYGNITTGKATVDFFKEISCVMTGQEQLRHI